MAFPVWTQQAREHWKQFQPNRYAALEKAGKLQEALEQAAEMTFREVDALENAGTQPDEAFQMVRERYLFPPQEDQSVEDEPMPLNLMHEMSKVRAQVNREFEDELLESESPN